MSGHDISDGGLVTCLLEMSFGGVCGLTADVQNRTRGAVSPVETLFAEELGWVVEVDRHQAKYVQQAFRESNVPCLYLGDTGAYGMKAKVN